MACNFKEPSVTKISEPFNIGESPVWDPREKKLVFVDIHEGKVLAYDYRKQITEVAAHHPGFDITPVILTDRNPYTVVVGMNRNFAKISLFDKEAEPLVLHTVHKDKPQNRFNDGKADSRGRIWIGTMGHEEPNGKWNLNDGALFKYSRDTVTDPAVMIPEVSIANGLAWNRANNKFYFIDTVTEEIAQYDYAPEVGQVSNRKVVFSTKGKGMGYPDGMTIDVEDNLWIALYGGGSVIQVNPTTGTLLRRIPIPAQYTTSVAWGGPNMDILFVTTSRRWMTPKEIEQQPGAGCLYAVTNLGVKGRPDFLTVI